MTDWAPWLGALAGSGLPGGADALQATFVVGTVFVGYIVLGTAGFGSALVAVLGLYIVAVGLRGLRARRGARPWRPAARACAVPAGFASGLVLAVRALRAVA